MTKGTSTQRTRAGPAYSRQSRGYKLFANGESQGNEKHLPNAAPGSKSLKIDKLISALENFREFPASSEQMYDAKEEIFQFIKNKDLQRFFNVADNMLDAAKALIDANHGKFPTGDDVQYQPNQEYIINNIESDTRGRDVRVRTDENGRVKDTIIRYNEFYEKRTKPNDTIPNKDNSPNKKQ